MTRSLMDHQTPVGMKTAKSLPWPLPQLLYSQVKNFKLRMFGSDMNTSKKPNLKIFRY